MVTTESEVYTRLAGRVNFPKSRYIRQVFQKLVTPEEGEMLLALPASTADLAQRFGLTEEAVRQRLDEFARKGVAIPLEREGVVRHFCVAHIIQFHDASIHGTLNKKYHPPRDEIVQLWRQFRETEWFEVLREREAAGQRGRVIPTRGAVKDDSHLLPHEDLHAIIRGAPAIGVVDCPCRWLGVAEGKCDKPTFVCLSLTTGSVKYILDRGIGKRLSVDEALQFLAQAEEAGLVPTSGTAGAQVRNLCFCCSDCCITLRPVVKYGYDLMDKSRFRASVDKALCNGCQDCVERCQFGAVEMRKEPGEKKYRAAVSAEKCYGCGVCVVKCNAGALSLAEVRPAERSALGVPH